MPEVFKITGITSDGRGVARRDDGRVAFFPGAVPGDEVLGEIWSLLPSGGTLEGRVVAIVRPSPDRMVHPCTHYTEGCAASPLGALKPEAGLNWKAANLRETLQRIGGLTDPPLQPPCAAGNPWGYRNRLELALEAATDGWRAGYTIAGQLLAISDCHLASPPIRAALPKVNSSLGLLGKAFPAEPLRLKLADNGAGGVCALLSGAFEGKALAGMRRFLNALSLAGWRIVRLSSERQSVSAGKTVAEDGDITVQVKVKGAVVRLPLTSFTQVNPEMGGLLASQVQHFAEGADRALDLFGGWGALSMGLPALVVDHDVAALAAGKSVAETLRYPMEFRQADLYAPKLSFSLRGFDVIILDPPRAGLSRDLAAHINQSGAPTLVYVSCHPAALARDLKRLTSYRCLKVIPLDMFPQTSDLEAIAVLERRAGE